MLSSVIIKWKVGRGSSLPWMAPYKSPIRMMEVENRNIFRRGSLTVVAGWSSVPSSDDPRATRKLNVSVSCTQTELPLRISQDLPTTNWREIKGGQCDGKSFPHFFYFSLTLAGETNWFGRTGFTEKKYFNPRDTLAGNLWTLRSSHHQEQVIASDVLTSR